LILSLRSSRPDSTGRPPLTHSFRGMGGGGTTLTCFRIRKKQTNFFSLKLDGTFTRGRTYLALLRIYKPDGAFSSIDVFGLLNS